MNNVSIIGNLVYDPELRFTGSGKAVCNFKVAVQRTYNREEADFLDVVTWEALAETVANHLEKGRQVGISGRITSRDWETKEGQRRTSIEIVAHEVKFLGGGSESSSKARPAKKEADDGDFDVDDDDVDVDLSDFQELDDDEDLPF